MVFFVGVLLKELRGFSVFFIESQGRQVCYLRNKRFFKRQDCFSAIC